MASGFKKSLFGFNCDEVVSYIEKMHKNSKEKEIVFNEKIEEMKAKLDNLTEENSTLVSENEELKKELDIFKEKYEEIEKLADNIGKLYLVAQTNAKAIMNNALENKEITDTQVKNNLTLIDNAQGSFDSLKENIIKSSYDFVAEVDSLLASLDASKKKIANNNIEDDKAINAFEEIFESITK